MGKKVQVPVMGGLRKVIQLPTSQSAGTTIQEFGSAVVTLAQLKAALGITTLRGTQVSGGGGTASLVVGPGLSGGGVLVGPVSIGLNAPIPWGIGDDGGDGGGEVGPPGQAGANGTTGAQGPTGPAVFFLPDAPEEALNAIPGAVGPQGLTGAQGPIGPAVFLDAEAGEDGQPGPPGAVGPAGAAGSTGPAGPAGVAGPVIWMPGDDGEDGQQGPPGPTGPAGTGGATTLSSVILADAPIGFWKCDDAATKLADSSGGGFDLSTVNGSVNYQYSPLIPGVPAALANVGAMSGTAAANGWQASTSLGATLPLTNWTLECVVSLYVSSGIARLFDFRVGSSSLVITLLTLNGQIQLYWNTGASPVITATTLGLLAPYHIVVTSSTSAGTSTLTVYQNGILVAIGTASASTASGGTPTVAVGALSTATTISCNIGYVALFASVLSKNRIAAHASAAGL